MQSHPEYSDIHCETRDNLKSHIFILSFLLCPVISIGLLPSGSQIRCYVMLESMYILSMIITCQSCPMGNFTPNIGFFFIYLANVRYNIKLKDERK